MKKRLPSENSDEIGADEVRDEILRQLYQIDSSSSICPSDVARSLFRMWREKMDLVRQVAADLASEGEIVVTQRNVAVDIETAKGPIRLKRKSI